LKRNNSGIFTIILAFCLYIPALTPVIAGEYHFGSSLICSECHTMHYSQQHQYDGQSGAGFPALTGGPNEFLLRERETQLCLGCHDGKTFAPDVLSANTGTHIRQAGALTTGSPPYENWKGHTLNVTATPPGGSMNIRLQCSNCHDAHGNTNYRNLDGVTNPITYAKGTNDIAKDVFLRGWTSGDIATNYSIDTVDYNEPNPRQSAMAKFCKGCHTDFHGQAGDSNMGGSGGINWQRHPTADANIGANDDLHSSLNLFKNNLYRVKVMSPSGAWGTPGQAWPNAPSDLTPTCVSCHKSHGNQNPYGLIFMDGTSNNPMTEEGNAATANIMTGLRGLCIQCHVQ
jgi:hypothetical protein